MRELVWILDSGKNSSLGNKGVFSNYIIPKNDLGINPKILAGNKLWVVLRGHEDRLLKLIRVKKVERILEGYHKEDFLISSELTESIKLVSSYPTATRYKVSVTRTLPLGISEIESDDSGEFRMLIKNNIQVKLTAVPENLLAPIAMQPLPNGNLQLVRAAIRAITTSLTLEQLWAAGTRDKLGAFSNFAYALIAKNKSTQRAAETVKELKSLDPIDILLKRDFAEYNLNNLDAKSMSPKVDTEFTEIEPNNIYAREFLYIDSKLKGLEDSLNKTEHAEKVHQEMLKDISMFLIKTGVTPYESGSIDLMYIKGEILNVFEIKSSSANNLLAQAAKGAFQLACYYNELSKIYDSLNTRLILHKTGSDELDEYAIEALHRLGIHALFYDPAKPWPNRVENILL
jgi:hypothetical protein